MFISSILRLVVTVAILAAVYFLIVKPVLNTTENVTKSVNHSLDTGSSTAKRAFKCVEHAGTDVDKLQKCQP